MMCITLDGYDVNERSCVDADIVRLTCSLLSCCLHPMLLCHELPSRQTEATDSV
jgi:hypothetical protein